MSVRFDHALGQLVAEFQATQRQDGSVEPTRMAHAGSLLEQIEARALPLFIQTQGDVLAEAFQKDLADWIVAGLDTAPCFDRFRDTLRPPAQGEAMFALMPVLATNGPLPRGYFLEFFLAIRDDPPECERAAQAYPHPKNKCQSVRLLEASRGFAQGNCLVFFPENIQARSKTTSQNYAVFFFSKFHSIFQAQTMPLARRAFGDQGLLLGDPSWHGTRLSPEETYHARSLWGYLHDYFHHQGPRPLDEHLPLKCRWATGLLEEIKVDSQVVLICLDRGVEFGAAITEFILLERLLRYPSEPDATRNFDAASGVLLWVYLTERAALRCEGDRFTLVPGALRHALRALVATIQAIEDEANDGRYLDAVTSFVRQHLPVGAPGEHFAFPDCHGPSTWATSIPRIPT